MVLLIVFGSILVNMIPAFFTARLVATACIKYDWDVHARSSVHRDRGDRPCTFLPEDSFYGAGIFAGLFWPLALFFLAPYYAVHYKQYDPLAEERELKTAQERIHELEKELEML